MIIQVDEVIKKRLFILGHFCCNFQLFIIYRPYPYTQRLLERQFYNGHLKLKALQFSENYFFQEVSPQYPVNGKLLCKILSEAAPRTVDLNHSRDEKFRTIRRMISMTDSHFSVTLQVKNCNVTKKELRHGHFTIISNCICNCKFFIFYHSIVYHIKNTKYISSARQIGSLPKQLNYIRLGLELILF